MRNARILAGAVLGISLFVAGAAFVSANAMAPSKVIVHDQPNCGGICGTGFGCSNADCPRCLQDKNGNFSCSG
jgi:hypothetical protein